MLSQFIHFGHYLRYAKLWIVIAVLPAIAAGALGYLHVKQQVKTYDATVTLYVQQASPSGVGVTGLPDLYTSALLAQAYSQLVTQPVIENAADQALARRYPGFRVGSDAITSQAASAQPNTTQQSSSPLITVTVTDTFAGRAADAANALAGAFIQQIKQMNQSRFTTDLKSLNDQLRKVRLKIDGITSQLGAGSANGENLRATLGIYQNLYQSLLTSTQQLKVTRDATSNSVSVYSPATPASAPNPLHPLRQAVLWAFLALLAGTGLLFGYEYLNDVPATTEEIAELAGAPVLGVVTRFRTGNKKRQLISASQPHSAAAEAYRLIRANIQFTRVDHPPRALVVTSPLPGDGKTTTASNLASVFAEGGKRVTLVDADLRRPTLHRIFGQPIGEGLTTLLVSADLNGLNGHGSDQQNLRVLASGPLPPNPADLLSSARAREVLTYLTDHSDLVILDSPPVLTVADAPILAAISDGVVLVIDGGKTRRREIRRSREAIEAVGGVILGVVINRLGSGSSLYYRYGYYRKYEPQMARDESGSPLPAS